MIRLFKLILFCVSFWAVERLCHKQTHGFQVTHVYSSRFETASEENPQEVQKMEALFSQPFTFLGSGGQTYAFLSADKKTVLKLFKHHHLRNEKKREAFFNSCKLAYGELKEDTALIYLKLHQSSAWKQPIIVIDRLGIRHELDPNLLQFALQEKVSLALRSIKKLTRTGKREEAKEEISALLDMLKTRCKKGIKDRDSGMRRNTGFLGKRAVSIDIGSFYQKTALQDPEEMKREIQAKTKRLAYFLEYYDLELWEYYKEKFNLTSN
jgi:hypothetical protein